MLSKAVDSKIVPSYFSYLPVRIHPDTAIIEQTTFGTIEVCSAPETKERKQAVYRHGNPYGNPYALCHGECDIGRLKLFVKVVEMIWIDDGTDSDCICRLY